MKLSNEIKIGIQEAAKRAGGYLTTDLFDKNRGNLPAWETLKKRLDIEFSELLKFANVATKDEYLRLTNKTKAISNFRIINLEHGYVSKSLYDSLKLSPSSEYISKYYGWNEIAKEAEVKLGNSQYVSVDEMINELKINIKKLGYIPTSTEYKTLSIKPSQEVLSNQGIQWSQAMRKAGYKPYGKTVTIKDKVCSNDVCFRQFTPVDNKEVLCEPCYKALRARLIKELDSVGIQKLKEISSKLLYGGNSQINVLDIFKSL